MTTNTYYHKSWRGNGDFLPIPSLFNPDGDLHLVFLSSNGIQFFEMTSDPWYRATIPGQRVYSQQITEGLVPFQPEEAASPMGCVRQWQFCNPSKSGNNCGPLASWVDAQSESAPLFGISIEDWENGVFPTTANTMGSRYLWLLNVLNFAQTTVGNIVTDLGPDALTSLKYLHSGLMGPLQANQWQLDVRYWWATFLASLQAGFVSTAHGPTDPALAPYEMLPFNSHAQDMCKNQVRYTYLDISVATS